MQILILGRNGQLGWALERRFADTARVTALDRDALDVADAVAVEQTISRLRPAVVLNATAYTAVDRAEIEPERAFAVNADAAGSIARACARYDAAMVHVSTDYVFDGRKQGRYVETDPTGPLGVYGRSKLAGEQAVVESGCAAIVLRTSWVYGEHGGNFAKTMLRLARERDTLNVVCDQHGAPTSAARLADATFQIVASARSVAGLLDFFAHRRGVYHSTAAGETTWHGYAVHLLTVAAENPERRAQMRLSPDAVLPIPTSAYPTPAARPANSLLDCTKLRETFGYSMPDWRAEVTDFVRRLPPHMQ